MGTRFRKSIKLAPGVKINVGKKSVGLSVGGKHAGMSFNSKTGVRARVSAPGTGLSYSTKVGGKKTTAKSQTNGSSESFFKKYWRLIIGLFFILSTIYGLGELEVGAVILGFVISAAFVAWHFLRARKAVVKAETVQNVEDDNVVVDDVDLNYIDEETE